MEPGWLAENKSAADVLRKKLRVKFAWVVYQFIDDPEEIAAEAAWLASNVPDHKVEETLDCYCNLTCGRECQQSTST